MALLDVSKVTSTLIKLLDEHVSRSPEWPTGLTLEVSPDPPDLLAGDNVLGVYLYHLNEDPHHKNVTPPGSDQPPIRFAPMALDLHYQVSAHTDGTEQSTLREQKLVGLAAKAMHDYPVIDDTTRIANVQILDKDLRDADNQLRILLQPIPFREAVNYWTAGESPLRLAAYYEVCTILLEPEVTRSRAGRVLKRNVETFIGGRPRLESSSSMAVFTLPGETQPHQLEIRPAQATPGQAVRFDGSGLDGPSTRLVLTDPRWADPVAVDSAAWSVVAAGDRITAVVQARTAPGPGGEVVFPGVHGAIAEVTRRIAGPRDIVQRSNETPFVVTPAVALSSPQPANLAAGEFEFEGGMFADAALDPGAVEAYFADAGLRRRGSATALQPGDFKVPDATHLRARLPAGVASGADMPFRVLVNGAESAPLWVVAP